MFVKTSFKGANMFKYTLGVFVINLILIVAWLMTSKSHAVEIIEHIELVVNSGIDLEIMLILKQIGMIFVWLIVAGIIEVALVFGIIMPIASSELKRGW